MKNIITLTTLLLTASASFAFADVKSDMKDIGTIFKALATNVGDASLNQQSAAAAAKLIPLFTDVQNLVPDSITSLSADQKPAAIADYKSLIQKEIDDAKALQAAFLANDNATAAHIVAEMSDTKKDGHDKYKQN